MSAAASTGLDNDSALSERDAVADLTSLDDVGVRISAATVVSADDRQVLGEAFQFLDEVSDVHGRTIAHDDFFADRANKSRFAENAKQC